MGSMRPVPGGDPSGASGGAPEGAQGSLASLAPDQAPQVGPDQSQQHEQLMSMVKRLEEDAALIASIDPTFGKFAQRIMQMKTEYLNLVARKSGRMGGTDQPRM